MLSHLKIGKQNVNYSNFPSQVVWCNNTTEKILGYGRDDMIGKDIREFQTTGSGDNITSKVGQNFEGITNCFDCSEL